MESFIRNYRAAKNEPPYVGIVHRLDQPVEGVMVFAKNQKAAASLSRQIKEHTTEKYYRAASRGQGVSGTAVEEEEAWGLICRLGLLDILLRASRRRISKCSEQFISTR